MSSLRAASGLAWVAALSACSGEPVTIGLNEPIRIPEAQFREGELPGLPPLTADEINAGVTPKTPLVSGISLGSPAIPPREPARPFAGLASPDSAAIGVRFADLGTGYWILPTGGVDVVNDGALEWKFRAAFGEGWPPGRHQLLFAGIGADGRSGNQVGLTLCLQPEIPDNGNTCNPAQDPPALVVSLGWDSAVDLDLRVITPSGKLVDSKHPTTADEDENGNVDPKADGVGSIDYDSFAACSPDGYRRENLVFQTNPPPGTYLVYANLFDACGEAGVTFDVSVSTSVGGDEPGTLKLAESFRQAAQLSAVHANGGAKIGLFITSFDVAP